MHGRAFNGPGGRFEQQVRNSECHITQPWFDLPFANATERRRPERRSLHRASFKIGRGKVFTIDTESLQIYKVRRLPPGKFYAHAYRETSWTTEGSS